MDAFFQNLQAVSFLFLYNASFPGNCMGKQDGRGNERGFFSLWVMNYHTKCNSPQKE